MTVSLRINGFSKYVVLKVFFCLNILSDQNKNINDQINVHFPIAILSTALRLGEYLLPSVQSSHLLDNNNNNQ